MAEDRCLEEISREIWESIIVLKIKKKEKVDWGKVNDFYRIYIGALAFNLLGCAVRNGYGLRKPQSLALLRERFAK